MGRFVHATNVTTVHNGEVMNHPASIQTSDIALLERMLLIRIFEEKVAELHVSGAAPPTCTSVGQEASAVGVVSALGPDDLILSNHRSAGHLLARNADPNRVMAEIMGKSTGYCQGRSGSLHVSAKDIGVVLTSTIVGGELSLVTGVGLALTFENTSRIATCFFGDGAACEGVFHESLNLAAVWKLPIFYVCENNQWQAFVHRRETMLGNHISEWARPYQVESITVDGNDVRAVYEAARAGAEYVRVNRAPFLLETYTYRLRGHMESDSQQYVDPGELAAWREQDPLSRYASVLEKEGVLTPRRYSDLKAKASAQVQAAADFALASPYPNTDSLSDNVYA
jgi:pyruvate dehydrogenase E1 component alpha subunit